mgnify:CR=1 FL=1
MPYISTGDGASVYYEDSGDGPPLVLIHGWGCTPRFFTRNTDPLSKQVRVINMALRGHGPSESVSYGHRISRYAADLRDLLAALDIVDATVLGWSMGAAVIWSHYELFGDERMKKMIIVDQSPRQYAVPGGQDWQGIQVGCYDAESLAVLRTMLALDSRASAEGIVHACFPDGSAPSQDEIDFFAGEIETTPGQVRADIMTDHTNLDWRDIMSRIRIPALVIVGEKSLIWGPGGAEYPAHHIPDARIERFAKSGHMPFYHEPDKFNRVVAEFTRS